MDQALDEFLSDHFLVDIHSWDVAQLREVRDRCQRIETSLSYLRRLAQGRIDIVATELSRRASGGDPTALETLVGTLPEVLAEHTHSSGAGHFPRFLAPGNLEGALVEELAGMEVEAHLSDLPAASEEWLTDTSHRLVAYEQRISGLRHTLFGRIDAIQEEITKRYRLGEASIDAIFAKK